MRQLSKSKTLMLYVLGGVLLFIGVVTIIIIATMYGLTKLTDTRYGIVIDAGSSHSSAFTYKWGADGTGKVVQDHKCDAKGLSLSDFTSDPSGAGPYLKPCIDESSVRLPWSQRADTPIYLGATAGMRLVEEANKSTSDAIMESVRKTIEGSSLDSSYLDDRVGIITGQKEGASLWISVNSITGALGSVTEKFTGSTRPELDLLPVGNETTVAVLDLGGASTQIAFDMLADSFKLPDIYRSNLTLYGTNFNLFTDSFLCYGINEFEKRLTASFAQKSDYSSTVMNYCYPQGHNYTTTYSKIFSSICTKPYRPAKSQAVNMTAPVTIIGNGSVPCSEHVKTLFNQTQCDFSSCSFDNHPLPSIRKRIVARSVYYYAVQSLDLNTTGVNRTEYVKKMEDACSLTLSQLQENPKFKFKPYRVCIQTQLVNALLSDVYNLTDWTNILFSNKLNGLDVEWSLGYMIERSSHQSDKLHLKLFNISLVWFVITFVLALILLIAGIVLIVTTKLRGRQYEAVRSTNI